MSWNSSNYIIPGSLTFYNCTTEHLPIPKFTGKNNYSCMHSINHDKSYMLHVCCMLYSVLRTRVQHAMCNVYTIYYNSMVSRLLYSITMEALYSEETLYMYFRALLETAHSWFYCTIYTFDSQLLHHTLLKQV